MKYFVYFENRYGDDQGISEVESKEEVERLIQELGEEDYNFTVIQGEEVPFKIIKKTEILWGDEDRSDI